MARKPSSAQEAWSRVARGLDYAHAKGVVHLDIKPANLILADSEDPCSLAEWTEFHEQVEAFGGAAALASYGWKGGPDVRPADVRSLIPREHIQFIKSCRDCFETARHFFAHAYYDPHLPLSQQKWSGLRWASLPPVPERHCSGKVAVVGHTPQKSGDILDLGYLKVIDTLAHGGGWLTALEVEPGRRAWQANEAGELR